LGVSGGEKHPVAGPVAALSFLVGYMWLLARSERASRKRYRLAVTEAMRLLEGAPLGPGAEPYAIDTAATLAQHLGGGATGARQFERRLLFYLNPENFREFLAEASMERLNQTGASLVLAETIRMPARWIRDVASGRRG
jgi:hypothetical protein